MADFYRFKGNTLILNIHLQPRAKRDEIVGPYDQSLKIAIKAPAIEGKANAYLIRFLAEQFDVPKQAITITKGQLSRNKVVQINHPKKLCLKIECPEKKSCK